MSSGCWVDISTYLIETIKVVKTTDGALFIVVMSAAKRVTIYLFNHRFNEGRQLCVVLCMTAFAFTITFAQEYYRNNIIYICSTKQHREQHKLNIMSSISVAVISSKSKQRN